MGMRFALSESQAVMVRTRGWTRRSEVEPFPVWKSMVHRVHRFSGDSPGCCWAAPQGSTSCTTPSIAGREGGLQG